MSTATFRVEGMTCSHCAAAVERELRAIDGVHTATVDLAGGRAEIISDAPLDAAIVRGTVEAAGYEVAS